MSNRIDRDSSSRLNEREMRIRAKQTQQKQINNFKQKLETQEQQGASAKQVSLSSEVLKRFSEGEEGSKAPSLEPQDSEQATQVPAKLLKQEQSQKNQKQQNTKQANQDLQVEKKHEKVVLEIAVQRRSQQEQENEGFGSSSQGDFFQQAVNIGMAALQTDSAQGANPVQIPEQALNEMVDKIFVGVDPQGISQFVIELKSNVLGGAQIQVWAQAKSVRLKFNGLDPSSKQSVKMASGDIKNRLAAKGLQLEQFDIV